MMRPITIAKPSAEPENLQGTGCEGDINVIRHAWAKLASDASLKLMDHGADVSAVLAALLDAGWTERFALCLGRRLRRDEIETLGAAAYLHDMGKANAGFWRRQEDNAPRVGHLREVLACPDLENRLGPLAGAFGADLFFAMLAHHGRPIPPSETNVEQKSLWRDTAHYSPCKELDELIRRATALFPAAQPSKEPMLSTRAVALFAGLLTLADWIGSSQARFPLDGVSEDARETRSRHVARDAVCRLGLNGGEALRPAAAIPFECAFPFEPRGLQSVAGKAGAKLTILEAETGSGKTEAALWRFLNLFARREVDGLYLALPTRTSAVQMHGRVERFLRHVFGDAAPACTLAVPGYLKAGDTEGTRLTRWEVLWPDDPSDEIRDARWSAEASKQFLAARIAVGTVDQILLSGLRVRHAHLRAACLARSLLVVDEVHASDAYMTEVLAQVLENHLGAGGHAMLLSATLGVEARLRLSGDRRPDLPPLAEAERLPYPAIHGIDAPKSEREVDKLVALDRACIIDNPSAIARRAVDASHAGARVLVIRNTVAGAIAVQGALEEEIGPVWQVDGVPALHHGRFAAEDREALDKGIEAAFGKNRAGGGLVAVGTQTLEISLDLDADLMITDLAPMDVLLQRLGRLHRHRHRARPEGFTTARLVMLTPEGRDLSPFLGKVRDRHGLGPSTDTMGGVYPDLAVLDATWTELETRSMLCLPADNRTLVERALHPDALDAVVARHRWHAFDAAKRGARSADIQLAREQTLDLSIPFSDLEAFPDSDIGTRLGAKDLLLSLPDGTPGAFGKVTQIRVPAWLASDVPPDVEPVVTPRDGGFDLTLDGKERPVALTYDRWGLRLT